MNVTASLSVNAQLMSNFECTAFQEQETYVHCQQSIDNCCNLATNSNEQHLQ